MRATTTTRLNLDTLRAHLGVKSLAVSGDPDSTDSKEVEADVPDLAAKLASYTYAEPAEQVAERSITEEAERALTSLRSVANGAGPMTTAQTTAALRSMARILIVLVRLQLKRFEETN